MNRYLGTSSHDFSHAYACIPAISRVEEETGARGDGTPSLSGSNTYFFCCDLQLVAWVCSDAFPGLVNAWEMIALGWDEVNVLVKT